jgi:hypothetical protein
MLIEVPLASNFYESTQGFEFYLESISDSHNTLQSTSLFNCGTSNTEAGEDAAYNTHTFATTDCSTARYSSPN